MREFTIPKPCQEKYGEMTSTQKGAFCGVCATDVIDLRNAGHDEIIQYFKQSATRKTCVNINSADLENANTLNWYSSISEKSKVKFVFMLSLIIAFTMNASAEELISNNHGSSTEKNSRVMGGVSDWTTPDDIVGGVDPFSASYDFVHIPEWMESNGLYIFTGGMYIPGADSAGYYKTKMDFYLENYPEKIEFDFKLKERSIEFGYASDSTYETKITIVAVEYDTTMTEPLRTTIYEGTQQLIKGEHEFTKTLGHKQDKLIEVTFEINGRQGTTWLYPKNYFQPIKW